MRIRSAPLLIAWFPFSGGCSEPAETPMVVAGISIPESAIANLGDADRQTLGDLVAFGAVVARDDIADLFEPVVEREAEQAWIAGLSPHLGAAALELGDDELRTAYLQDPEWELVVRHVVRLAERGDPQAVHDSARAVAHQVAAAAAAGEDFASLAGRFSEEPGADRRGGLLAPGRRGSWVEPFWLAASSLEPGEVSEVVETSYGYHVLRLDERRPVPFEEANPTELLRRIVPEETAAESIREWSANEGGILLDPPAVSRARTALISGSPLSDTLVIARGAAGGEYRGDALTASWARLPIDERNALTGANEVNFAAWLERDARDAIWAGLARDIGVAEPTPIQEAARRGWTQRGQQWAAAFGFRSALSDEQILMTSVAALLSGSPEARAARQELRGLRPLLRLAYPIVVRGP